MIRFCLFLLLAFVPTVSFCIDTVRHEVLLKTSEGDIVISLYNETPRHRDNFLKLVKSGWYDGQLFHRAIKGFMIQTGDSASRHAVPGQTLGVSAETYTIPAEIRYPQFFHKCGAVAAAREGDASNPQRASSMSQFYIVYGQKYTDASLDKVQETLDKRTGGKVKLSPDIRDVYKTQGGAPSLDGQYTIFGEVVRGLDVVQAIQNSETDSNSRPLKDVRIIKATVIK